MSYKKLLYRGGEGGKVKAYFLSTGVGGEFTNSDFGAYVLYGWPLG